MKNKIPLWLWYVAIGGVIYYYMKKSPPSVTLPAISTSPGGLQQIEAGLGGYVLH